MQKITLLEKMTKNTLLSSYITYNEMLTMRINIYKFLHDIYNNTLSTQFILNSVMYTPLK